MQVSGFKAKGDDMESWERKRREERYIVREGGGERTQIGFDHLGHWKLVICIGLKLGGRVCAAFQYISILKKDQKIHGAFLNWIL